MWTCSYCGHENENPSKACKRCERAFEQVAPSEIRKKGLVRGVAGGIGILALGWFLQALGDDLGVIMAPIAGLIGLTYIAMGVLQALTGKNIFPTSSNEKK